MTIGDRNRSLSRVSRTPTREPGGDQVSSRREARTVCTGVGLAMFRQLVGREKRGEATSPGEDEGAPVIPSRGLPGGPRTRRVVPRASDEGRQRIGRRRLFGGEVRL